MTILGSGTSMGIPTLGCDCRVCVSTDPRDTRTRPSVSIRWDNHGVLIDTGPDFRQQALREGIRDIDAILYTHAHADHILGLDDLRPLSFRNKRKIPLYADEEPPARLKWSSYYTFATDALYLNRAPLPIYRINGAGRSVGVPFQPVPLLHGEMQVTGFRFGNTADPTHTNYIPEREPTHAPEPRRRYPRCFTSHASSQPFHAFGVGSMGATPGATHYILHTHVA